MRVVGIAIQSTPKYCYDHKASQAGPTVDPVRSSQMECRETFATLQVDAAPLVSGLVPTNIVDTKHLDASNVAIPGGVVKSGQAKLLSARYTKHHTCYIHAPAPDRARSMT